MTFWLADRKCLKCNHSLHLGAAHNHQARTVADAAAAAAAAAPATVAQRATIQLSHEHTSNHYALNAWRECPSPIITNHLQMAPMAAVKKVVLIGGGVLF